MTVRWQTGEVRSPAVWLDEDAGAPLLGATPTAVARRKDTGALLPAPSVVELGDGFYRLDMDPPPADAVVLLGLSPTRFVPLEVEVGGWVDQVDAAVSSRASAVQVEALGSPAQSDALGALDDAVAALSATVGTPAQVAAVQALQAAVDAVAGNVDVPVSTRATPADLQTRPVVEVS